MNDERKLVDPEPFGIIVSAVVILGGIASVVSAVGKYLPNSPTTNRRRIKRALNSASDLVRYVETDLSVIESILSSSEVDGSRLFRPRLAAFLDEDDFTRYEKTTAEIFTRLGSILKETHKIDKLLPKLSNETAAGAAGSVLEIENRLERLLFDRQMSIDQVLREVKAAVSEIGRLIDGISSSL